MEQNIYAQQKGQEQEHVSQFELTKEGDKPAQLLYCLLRKSLLGNQIRKYFGVEHPNDAAQRYYMGKADDNT